MTPSVAVIIVTYNGESVIGKCLDTLTKSTDLLHSIIVVDNNSTDDTLKILDGFKDHIQLVKLNNNLGFGQANNKGIVKALDQGAEYVLLLNQDVYFDRNNLKRFLERSCIPNHQDIGIFSPIHLDGSGKLLDYNFKTFLFKNKPSKIVDAYFLNSKYSHKSFQIDFINAAIWLIPRNVLAIVGGFDPIFFHYGEDRNYVNRLHYHDLFVHVIPDCYAIHDRQQQDGTYKKENLARFQFVVEATDLNIHYSVVSLLFRIVYRNYITKTRDPMGLFFKSFSDAIISLLRLRKIKKVRKEYSINKVYRFLEVNQRLVNSNHQNNTSLSNEEKH